jgi:hypothetical protein
MRKITKARTKTEPANTGPSLAGFIDRLRLKMYVEHEDRDGYFASTWTSLENTNTLAKADVISSELIGTDDRHGILLDLDFAVQTEPYAPAYPTIIAVLPPGRSKLKAATTSLGRGHGAIRRELVERHLKAGWGVTERDIRKLHERLSKAGLDGIVSVAHLGLPRPNAARKGRFYLELALTANVWVVPSRTEGHHHLYVDVPDGLTTKQYRALRKALYKANVIEKAHTWADATYLRPPRNSTPAT